MAKTSKSEFIAGLKKSGIVDPARLAEFLNEVEGDTPEAIAKHLVREELATKWQAKYLMSGRIRLDIGSYRLLERINRDEFGDRFLAVHTSLARKVDIQVLPGNLTKDQSSCDRFIQKASLAAQLDHPNLTHVYDIDQEGGRYYMVTEHVDGKTLEETDTSKLTDVAIARIISQALEGISYAHQHKVIHGCIGPADLVLDDQSQVKIQHLPLSPLRQQISDTDEQPTTEQDFSAIARIGSFLLKKGNISDESNRSELATAFKTLSKATPESVASTSASLARFLTSASMASDFSSGGFDQPINSTSGQREKPQPVENEPDEVVKSGYLSQLWRDNPVAVIGTSLVIALLLVGGSVYGGISLFGGGSSATSDQLDENGSKRSIEGDRLKKLSPQNSPDGEIPSEEDMQEFLASFPKVAESAKGKNKKPGRNKPKQKDPPVFPQDRSLPDEASKNAPGSPGKPDANLNGNPQTADSTVVVGPNVVHVNIEPKPGTTEPEVPGPIAAEPTHTDLTVISGIAEKTQSILQTGNVKSLEQIASMNPEEVRAAIRAGGWRTANKIADYRDWIVQAKAIIGDESPMKASPESTEEPTANSDGAAPETTGPFANFPRVTGLPPMEDTTEIKIADLVIPRQYLLGAELICEKGAAKGRSTFELERSPDDKQTWVVGVKKSPNQKATQIATFRKSENAFHFQWLPAATTDKNASKLAPYLSNCFVKLILPEDQSTILTLRRPIKIADLRLTGESLWKEIEFQIPAMPEAENIVVEVLPLRIPNVETKIPNARVERGSPARIWLKKNDKTGILWIQVSGELRSKLKLRSNLTVLLNGNAQPVPGLKDLEALAVALDAAAVRSQRIHDSFTFPSASLKRADFDKKKAALSKDAKDKKAIKDKLIGYGEILPKILNQPISVRVYSKLGNIQTVLAVSDPTIEQEKEKEKK